MLHIIAYERSFLGSKRVDVITSEFSSFQQALKRRFRFDWTGQRLFVSVTPNLSTVFPSLMLERAPMAP